MRYPRSFRIGRSNTGLGLFATKPFKRRGYIATYRGPAHYQRGGRKARAARRDLHVRVEQAHTIDGSPRYNIARYINHSCRPNAEPVARNGGIVIIALDEIEPGEEITYDYGKEYLEYFLERRLPMRMAPREESAQAPQGANARRSRQKGR